MKSQKLNSAPPDIRTEWRRLNDVRDDLEDSMQTSSSDPHLISLTRNAQGVLVLDSSILVQILTEKGIDLSAL